MPLFDYECGNCGFIEEKIIVGPSDPDEMLQCPHCNAPWMKRIITASRESYNLTDAPWIKSVTTVVNKNPKSQKPEDREMLRNPTRKNYQKWMKANNLRPLDPGEKNLPKVSDHREFRKDMKGKLVDRFNRGMIKRGDSDRIEIGG